MDKHPEAYVDLEEALRDRQISKDVLENLLEEVRENRNRHYGILEDLSKRGGKFLRYNLLILALAVTSVSLLFQAEIIQDISALDTWMVAVPVSLISASFIFSLLSLVPLSWSRKDLVSRYETQDEYNLGEKSSIRTEIEDQIGVIEALREMVFIRKFNLFLAQACLMLMFISLLIPLSLVFSMEKVFFVLGAILCSLLATLVYNKYFLS